MKKFDLQQQKTLIMVIIFSIIALWLYFAFLFSPKLSQIIMTGPKLAKLQKDVESVRTDLGRMEALKTRSEQLSTILKDFKKRLIRQVEVPALLETISLTADSSDAKVITLIPSGKITAQEGDVYQAFPVNIKAESGYHQLGTFVNELENAKMFLRISNINIKQKPSDAKTHNIDLEVEAFVIVESE